MMSATCSSSVQMVFRALSDPTRRDILMYLSEHDMAIGEVCEHFNITRAAVKKHLKILEEGNLISVHINGRERINRLQPKSIKPALEWISFFEKFWDERLNELQKILDQDTTDKN